MALNYTNPIEIRHPEQQCHVQTYASNNIVMFLYHSHNTNLDNSFFNYSYVENYIKLFRALFPILFYP